MIGPVKGYELTLPRKWDKKYGLALRISLSNPQKEVLALYAEIKQIAELVQDPDFRRSGLKKAVGPDGSTAYVAPGVVGLYTEKGKECIGLTCDEVSIMIDQLQGQSDGTQTDDNEVLSMSPKLPLLCWLLPPDSYDQVAGLGLSSLVVGTVISLSLSSM
jgi:hypothetical protein